MTAERPEAIPFALNRQRPKAEPIKPDQTVMFDTLWPRRRAGAVNAATAAAMPAAKAEPGFQPAPADDAATAEPAALSVLKSGVVEGMAYALYTDGSIEAQLPQGLLRVRFDHRAAQSHRAKLIADVPRP